MLVHENSWYLACQLYVIILGKFAACTRQKATGISGFWRSSIHQCTQHIAASPLGSDRNSPAVRYVAGKMYLLVDWLIADARCRQTLCIVSFSLSSIFLALSCRGCSSLETYRLQFWTDQPLATNVVCEQNMCNNYSSQRVSVWRAPLRYLIMEETFRWMSTVFRCNRQISWCYISGI